MTANGAMPKLLRLKAWVTVDEAAGYLGMITGEPVTRADILRFALDRHLRMSVNLVNHARVRKGKIVTADELEYHEWPVSEFPNIAAQLREMGSAQTTFKTPKALRFGETWVAMDTTDAFSISGVHDLPLWGNEGADLEHEYQRLTGGPAVTLQCIEGAFATDSDGTVYQFQDHWDENEYQLGSNAARRVIEARVASGDLSKEDGRMKLDAHAIERENLKRRWKENPDSQWYPASALPGDAVLVVTTAALTDLVQKLIDVGSSDLGATRAEGDLNLNSALTIMGAMLKVLAGDVGKQAGLIADIEAATTQRGLRRRTLEKYFAAANRKLQA